ncbi:MAG TPA: molybdopterin-dependent oxidoreductase [Aggregatilinea sp.]|uniref:molybdopterin-dependent oxidoreductase n=1 Tax=Aggregatilinea sp. TaxID=2806333 RepID=UPI002BABFA29|nr:molybdopterin cofactor-binding domain-containing protein [Aggregatilinea sp.]HML22901.1 molybdopterin-dependent oxidoreductase [Aggregatilinea sp.]
MEPSKVEITLTINKVCQTLAVEPGETLLAALRRASYFSVKTGCDDGTCGVCTVLVNGRPIHSCKMKAVDLDGAEITTIEGLNEGSTLHPLQEAFVETGAIQCGFCTPALILTAKALLDRNPDPTDDDIRKALNGVLCRCTGYVRGVDAVHRAAAMLRGETLAPYTHLEQPLPDQDEPVALPEAFYRRNGDKHPLPPLVVTPKGMAPTRIVGKSEVKVDARKLAMGRPVFTDDLHLHGMLYGALLTSPHAHARIRNIDASRARALPGVHAVLTHHDIPRVKYASGGQSYPQPLPYDQVSLDDKVRHVGDRVAIVAAETPEIARQALDLIEVDYELLPAIIDPECAMQDGAPIVHDEPDTEGIYDAQHNIVHHIAAEVGDVDQAFALADHVFEGEYRTPKQQHVHLEPHACITYFDENERLVIRTSTQVPFHIRRMVAPLIDLPIKRIRVIKPRIGGGFGNKQEMILEDLCAHLTLATGRPVRMEYTRTQEFNSSRSRHANIIRYKIGIKDEQVTAASLYLIGDTGAYGAHALTVNMVGGFKGLTLYNAPNTRFISDVVYTNTPPAGAFRGYGAMQCEYGIEVMMEEIATQLGLNVVDFKRKNWLKVGESMHLSKALGEGREGTEQTLLTSGLEQCVRIGMEATGFEAKRQDHQGQQGRYRHGIGMAVVMHGSGIAGLDMASATLKMNDDGSFNLLIGATDLGTGSDTVLAQMAAEVLDIPLDDIIVYSSDTDFTPFDKGAYASSTTYISGGAVRKAALQIKAMLLEHAALILNVCDPSDLELKDGRVTGPDGRFVTLGEIGLSSLHQRDQHQIIATASHTSPLSPPPTAAQFAEIVLDTETGHIEVERLLMVVDCGRVINPTTAAGQVEGGMSQALGFALTEEMLFDAEGQPLNADLMNYHVPRALDMPVTDVIFVQTHEPSGPFGAKSVSEIAIDGVAPAIASAIHDATGVWMRQLPYTPERVKAALQG